MIGATPGDETPKRILAIADTDSYLKWSSATLAALPPGWQAVAGGHSDQRLSELFAEVRGMEVNWPHHFNARPRPRWDSGPLRAVPPRLLSTLLKTRALSRASDPSTRT